MMPDLDTILDVLESNYSATEFRFVGYRFSGREYVFQDLHNSLSQSRCETFEDKMRIGFTDCATGAVWYVMT